MAKRSKITLVGVVVMVLIALFIGVLAISTSHHMGDVAGTAVCESNLHQIGLAIAIYEDANHGQFPRTLSDDSDDPTPTWGTPYQSNPNLGPVPQANPFKHEDTSPAANDVTASLFLLARTTQLPSGIFVCYASPQKAWDYGGSKYKASNWTNWKGNAGLLAHLSYSFQNVFVSPKAVSPLSLDSALQEPTFALAADINPGLKAASTVNLHSTLVEMKVANSPNHNGRGQNVLYGDFHAEWAYNPLCGSIHDNIFTTGGPEVLDSPIKNLAEHLSKYSSTGPQDSILLPTAADLQRY